MQRGGAGVPCFCRGVCTCLGHNIGAGPFPDNEEREEVKGKQKKSVRNWHVKTGVRSTSAQSTLKQRGTNKICF